MTITSIELVITWAIHVTTSPAEGLAIASYLKNLGDPKIFFVWVTRDSLRIVVEATTHALAKAHLEQLIAAMPAS